MSFHVNSINELHRKARKCSSYLGQSNMGGIRTEMRHDSIHALTGLSQALSSEQALNANLQAQLHSAEGLVRSQTSTISSLQNALRSALENGAEAAEASRIAAEKLIAQERAAAEAQSTKAELERERAALQSKYDQELDQARQDFEVRLEKALEEAEELRKSKKKLVKSLTLTLSFAKDQGDAAVGWLARTHHYTDLTFPSQIAAFEERVRLNPEQDLDDTIMGMVDGLEALRLGGSITDGAAPAMLGGAYDLDPHGTSSSPLKDPQFRQA